MNTNKFYGGGGEARFLWSTTDVTVCYYLLPRERATDFAYRPSYPSAGPPSLRDKQQRKHLKHPVSFFQREINTGCPPATGKCMTYFFNTSLTWLCAYGMQSPPGDPSFVQTNPEILPLFQFFPPTAASITAKCKYGVLKNLHKAGC